ncbi:MAG: radical SAM protein [Candidatus Omnitrophica bacterium]|nr:radical SAM protein [Candidatus Omnitrophota bacterium]MCM8793093.1 radical SAM protein [Candidatus Omnitrophota bacterium]
MAECKVCQKKSFLISDYPGVCLDCIRNDFERAKPYILEAHKKTRKDFALPFIPPKEKAGILCNLCVNECRIGENEKGFCDLRKNLKGKLIGADVKRGNLSFYFDPLPTNCVADWTCPGGTGCGFPEFSYQKGPEYGYKNLAVFYNGCSYNCLFCQNWHFRDALGDREKRKLILSRDLASIIDEKTSCICFFGGDPSCQLPHSILTSKIALKNKKNRILRICWETNGSMNENLLAEIVEIALASGGCIKFDLKAWTEELNIALCGVSNKRTFDNFAKVSSYIKKRPIPPLLIASTLLVPGYVDEYEIEKISKFIYSLNKNIPYSLLAFYPSFYMHDLPTTSYPHAYRCKEVALNSGLKNVHIGNFHLLSHRY